jgi:hypothetical protein
MGGADEDGPIRQWKDIAAHLGVSVDTAQDYANRNRDPLPVFVDHRGVHIHRHVMRDWVDRQRLAYVKHVELKRAARAARSGNRRSRRRKAA